ncbi:lysylphosphatidylglycerol synthase transmembrane domain-containing protein [Arenicella sp. 4NH20-0111]|uniref:lysylphosphatidylglycerol synthase transmembrane domain-containing protein n=1 Tax=Arenicella sp. 4NH20-0111 TaxID=3127648 RepID=UPI0033414FEB
MNKSVLKFLQIFIAFVLLGVLVNQAGLFSQEGRQLLWSTLSGANLNWLVVSVLVGVVINMVSAFKWWALIRSQKIVAGYWRIFSYYLVGQFYNQVLPTSVGGDVVRSYELGKYSGRQADSLASVFVERYTGVLVLLVLAGMAVLAQLSRFDSAYIIVSLVAFSFGLGLIAWLVLDLRAYHKVRSWFVVLIPKLEPIFLKIDSLLDSILAYRKSRSAIVFAFANSFLFYVVAVINVYVTAKVFQSDVQLIDVILATPVIMLLMNLPISFGNLFLMEASYTGILALMGYSPALGLSIAFTMRIKSLIDGLMGGVLHPFFVTQKHE